MLLLSSLPHGSCIASSFYSRLKLTVLHDCLASINGELKEKYPYLQKNPGSLADVIERGGGWTPMRNVFGAVWQLSVVPSPPWDLRITGPEVLFARSPLLTMNQRTQFKIMRNVRIRFNRSEAMFV